MGAPRQVVLFSGCRESSSGATYAIVVILSSLRRSERWIRMFLASVPGPSECPRALHQFSRHRFSRRRMLVYWTQEGIVEESVHDLCPRRHQAQRPLSSRAPQPMLPFRIHHVAVICSNYDVSRRFSTELLGLRIVAEHFRASRNSHKLDLALPDGSQIELFSFPNPPARRSCPEACGLRHLAFAVEDVVACKSVLESKGIAVEPVRIDEFTNKPFTFLADPDGLPIELYEARSVKPWHEAQITEPRGFGATALLFASIVSIPFGLALSWAFSALAQTTYPQALPFGICAGAVLGTLFGLAIAVVVRGETVCIDAPDWRGFVSRLNLATAELGYHPATDSNDFLTYKPSYSAGLFSGTISAQRVLEKAIIVGPRMYVRKLRTHLSATGHVCS